MVVARYLFLHDEFFLPSSNPNVTNQLARPSKGVGHTLILSKAFFDAYYIVREARSEL